MLLLGPMCHFILSTTNATCLASVHSMLTSSLSREYGCHATQPLARLCVADVLDTICRWLSHLRKEVRFLPSCIDFSDLYRAIKILLDCPRVDIALITLETLYKCVQPLLLARSRWRSLVDTLWRAMLVLQNHPQLWTTRARGADRQAATRALLLRLLFALELPRPSCLLLCAVLSSTTVVSSCRQAV